MIQSCLFSVKAETKRTVTWNIYTNEYAAKVEFFSNEGKKAHICANSAEGWRDVFTEVCLAISHSQQGRVNQLYNVGYWSLYPWSIPFIFIHNWPHHCSLTVIPYKSATLKCSTSRLLHIHTLENKFDWTLLQASVRHWLLSHLQLTSSRQF